MSLKFSRAEVKRIIAVPLSHGHTARMNHDGCTAGTDTRRRLYLTKQPTGSILAYCHNCGEGGIVGSGGPRVRTSPAAPTGPSAYTLPVSIPLTDLGQLWLTAWGLGPVPMATSTPDDDGIVFHFPEGHQIRWFKNPALKWQIFGDCEYNVDGESVIICEDMISAIKWMETDPENGGICLFGANPGKAAVSMPRKDQVFLVWLDNDNNKVNENAELIARKLSDLTSNVVLCQGGTDPKRYTAKELIDVRDQARKLCGTSTPADKPYHVLEVPIPNQRVRAGLGVKRNPSGSRSVL